MNILLINQDWFAKEWREDGHTVVVAGIGDQCDVRLPMPLVHWQELCPQGFAPDRIMVHDNSSPVVVCGLEDAEVPTAFYSVDTHHHANFHRLFSGSFDATFVAQRDYLPKFHEVGVTPHWLPLWASRFVEASDEKRFQAVFVGTMDPALNPERVAFFSALKERVPLVIERGEYWRIFPHGEIVVNQTVKSDLNFRVFEGMMCGALMLTEESGNGLTDLFVPGEHLVTYRKNDVDDAAQKIEHYLAHRAECRAIATAGRSAILEKHLPQHRAATVMEVLRTLERGESTRRFFGAMVNYHLLSLSYATIDPATMIKALFHALRCLEAGAARNEELSQDLATHALMAAVRYDLTVPGRAGAAVLREVSKRSPNVIITLGVIREHLNNNERELAAAEAEKLNNPNIEEVFALSEKLVTDLLSRMG